MLRIRIFHRAFFGLSGLRFIGFDQKPFYFCSAAMCKTLALRGAKKVAVKENLAASRERFSIMTTCDSGAGDGESCSIGILFRTQGSSGERIAASLRKRREALLQCVPNGSYRFEHAL